MVGLFAMTGLANSDEETGQAPATPEPVPSALPIPSGVAGLVSNVHPLFTTGVPSLRAPFPAGSRVGLKRARVERGPSEGARSASTRDHTAALPLCPEANGPPAPLFFD